MMHCISKESKKCDYIIDRKCNEFTNNNISYMQNFACAVSTNKKDFDTFNVQFNCLSMYLLKI